MAVSCSMLRVGNADEDHQVTVCWDSSQGYLQLAPGNLLANTAPGVIPELV